MARRPRGFRRLHRCFRLRSACAAALLAVMAAAGCSEERVLTLELTTRLDDGTVVESTEGREPMVVTLGDGKLLPALERQLADLEPGAERQIVLEAADAYGERNPELLKPVPVERIPEDSRVVGAVVIGEAPDGTQRPLRVHEIKPDEIILDLNHPLAGERLHFDVKVLAQE